MTGIVNLLDQPRTLDALGRPTSAVISYFLTGTTTLANIYQDEDLTIPQTNPITLSSGQLFPPVFLDSATTYRRKIVYGDGSIHDIDPLSNIVSEILDVRSFGAVGDGVADDSTALLNTGIAARAPYTDGTGRTFAGEIYLPPGRYKIDEILEFAPAGGLVGFTVTGAGAGSTEIVYSGATATIKATSSRSITWRDLTFVSSGVDSNQVAFTINQTGNPLRSWRFERCEFQAFYKCFAVTGTSMCSEFYFVDCKFQQCYWLMENDNDQAVNWNFVNCDWENNELTTVKDKNLASILHLKKGTFCNWSGGSIIPWGSLVYCNLTAGGVFQRTSHKVVFDGIRVELVDDGAGGHAPLIDRVTTGYTSGSNSPTTSIKNATILNRGAIPTTVTYAKLWANCSLEFSNVEAEGGKIIGIIDGVTAASNGDLFAVDYIGLEYEEDITARVSSHDQHSVTMIPDTSSAASKLLLDQRLNNLTVINSTYEKRLWVRGSTGSLPQASTTVNLPAMKDHFILLKMFVYRFTVAGQSLTVEIRDQADTTTYGTLTIGVGVTNLEAYVGKELGYEIPTGTPLMLKFTGTPEVVKGIVGIEYL